jgi:hypothetical protein
MKIGVMQPYLFPYLGYFQHINAVDRFVLLDDVNFIKKGYINRNQILLNGEAFRFTLPLQKVSQNKLICEIEITPEIAERYKILENIKNAYKKAPYFTTIYPAIESILLYNETNLAKFLANSIINICSLLDIKTEIIPSSQIYPPGNLTGQERILDIVKKNNANMYINPIGGTELYSQSLFEQNEVVLKFHKMKEVVYKQYSNSFVPYLSIIDILMFCDQEKIAGLLLHYELI